MALYSGDKEEERNKGWGATDQQAEGADAGTAGKGVSDKKTAEGGEFWWTFLPPLQLTSPKSFC